MIAPINEIMRTEIKTIGFMSKSVIPIMIEPINKTAPKDNAKTKVNVNNKLIPYPNSNQVSTIPVLVMAKFFNAVCLRLFWLRYFFGFECVRSNESSKPLSTLLIR
jgi:hypothetical protein